MDNDYSKICHLCGEAKNEEDRICEKCDNQVLSTHWDEDKARLTFTLRSGIVVVVDGWPIG